MPKININHALVFSIIGLIFGIAMTSFICIFQKTNNINTEKEIWEYFKYIIINLFKINNT